MSKGVLITGGAGFIGSHLTEFLVKQDYNVTVIDNLTTGNMANLSSIINKINFIEADIRDIDLISNYFQEIDYIVHLAAMSSVALSLEKPVECNDINISSTLNLLELSKKFKIKKFVFASSSAVYGNPQKDMLANEFDKTYPLTPYAVSKLGAEHYCHVYSEIHNLSTVSLRLFNVYGPRQNSESEYSAVIPKFAEKLINNNAPVIYGDGHQSRDFVYINDVVSAFALAMKTDHTGIYNIASGNSYSVNELFEILVDIFGKDMKPQYAPARIGEVKYSQANISLAMSKLRYNPKYSLRDGLMDMLKHPVYSGSIIN